MTGLPRWGWTALSGLGPLALVAGWLIGWAVDLPSPVAVADISARPSVAVTVTAAPTTTPPPVVDTATAATTTHTATHTATAPRRTTPALAPFLPAPEPVVTVTPAPTTAVTATPSAHPTTTADPITSITETTTAQR